MKQSNNATMRQCHIFSRALLILGAVFFLTGFFSHTRPAAAVTVGELEEKIKEIESQTRLLEERAGQFRTLITEKLTEIHSLEGVIQLLNSQILEVENKINISREKIKIKNLKIEKLGLQINALEEKVFIKKDLLAEFLRMLNREEKVDFLAFLLRQQSLSDIFAQTAQFLSLQERLQDSLNLVKDDKASLETARTALIKEKQSLAALTAKLATEEEMLTDRSRAKRDLLRETKGKESEYRRLLSETEAERSRFLKQQQAVEAEIERLKNFLVFVESGAVPPAGTRLFLWPEKDPILTQGYGMTAYARTGAYGGKGHNGLDMSAGFGAPVRAAADGTIIAVGRTDCYNFRDRSCNGFWGNWMAIEHKGGLVTLYAHLKDKSPLPVGAAVTAGDRIGQEGSSGNSTGSHLHFSVYRKFFTFERNGWLLFNYIDGTLNPRDYL